jgi:hypothetical protein
MSLIDVLWFLVSYFDLLWYVVLPVLIVIVAGWWIFKHIGETQIERITGHEADRVRLLGEVLTGPGWLEENNFQWVGAFRFVIPNVNTRFAAWKQHGNHTYICVYRTKGENIPGITTVDIVSIFGRRYALTTTGSSDGPLLPIGPGCYKQMFDTKNIHRLWEVHSDAETIVAPTDLRTIDTLEDQGFETILKDTIKDELAFIRSLWFWQLRMPWWYFVNRKRNLNKTVMQRMGIRERRRLGIE